MDSTFDSYQLQCIELWNTCLNDPDFLKGIERFFTNTVCKDGVYCITFDHLENNDKKRKCFEGVIIVVSQIMLRWKWHIKNNKRIIGGILTKILKLNKKRIRNH